MNLFLAKLDKEINSYAYAATHHIIKTSKDLLKLEEEQYKQINNIFTKIIQMDPNKIHKRVLEIQDNLESSSDENKIEMLNDLISMVSQIEQSLSEVKIDIESLNNENK
jgi:2,3-bisphosphoglycerate-independent phosphoglycerate mutase